MKNVHKCLLVLLAAVMLLTGCGTSQEDVSGKVTPNEASPTAAPTSSVETVPEETEETPVSLGRIEGGVYTNTYAGFGCELDSNWVFYSAEELQALPGDIQELFADTEFGDSMNEMTQIMDMKAENANDMTVINVLYSQMDTQTRLLYAMMSEEDIVDAMLDQKDLLVSTYAQAGIEVSAMEKVEVDFLGEKHFAVRTSSTWDGVPYFTLQLFDYHAGRYSITTTFSSYLEDKTDDMLDLFYKVD